MNYVFIHGNCVMIPIPKDKNITNLLDLLQYLINNRDIQREIYAMANQHRKNLWEPIQVHHHLLPYPLLLNHNTSDDYFVEVIEYIFSTYDPLDTYSFWDCHCGQEFWTSHHSTILTPHLLFTPSICHLWHKRMNVRFVVVHNSDSTTCMIIPLSIPRIYHTQAPTQQDPASILASLPFIPCSTSGISNGKVVFTQTQQGCLIRKSNPSITQHWAWSYQKDSDVIVIGTASSSSTNSKP